MQFDFYNSSLMICRKSLCYMISIIFCLSLLVQCNDTTGTKEIQYKSRFTLKQQEFSNTSIQYNQTSLRDWNQFKYSKHYIFSDESNLPIDFTTIRSPEIVVEESESTSNEQLYEHKEETGMDEEHQHSNKIGSSQKHNNILYSNLKTRSNNIKLQNQQSFTSPIKDRTSDDKDSQQLAPMSLILSNSHLEFNNVGLCMTSTQDLTISNPSDDSIQILSLVSYSPFYYCGDFLSSFILEPRSSKVLTITFQPNEIGVLESTFIINTNIGEYSFSVGGKGISNLYHLSSINQVLIQNIDNNNGENFEHLIYPISIYNPHNSTLRILNIFTNDYPFFLTIPNDWKKSKNNEYLWEIKPFTKVNIINLYFKGKSTIGQYNGLINIESNFDSFIINVDIKVLKNEKTIHILQEEIDFGYLSINPQHFKQTRGSINSKGTSLVLKSKKIPLNLVNSDSLIVSIKSDEGTQKKLNILNDTLIQSHLESIHDLGYFQWTFRISPQDQQNYNGRVKEFSGQYLIHFKSNTPVDDEENYYESTIVLQWKIKLIIGEISYPQTDRLFKLTDIISSNTINSQTQQLTLKNQFILPVQIQSMFIISGEQSTSLEFNSNSNDDEVSAINIMDQILLQEKEDDRFEIQAVGPLFSKVVYPGQYWDPINITYRKLNRNSEFKVSSHSKLLIQSNISNFEIDLHSFTGHFDFIPIQQASLLSVAATTTFDASKNNGREMKSIDFGLITVQESRKKSFLLKNPTPHSLVIECVQLVNLTKLISSNVDISLSLENIYNEKFSGADSTVTSNILTSDCPVHSLVTVLDAGYIASFQIELTSKVTMNVKNMGLMVKSNLSSQIIPIHFNISSGSLKIYPQHIQFDNNELTKPLFAHNTYDVPVNITSIDSSDSKVICNITEITLPPHRVVLFANLIIDSNLIFQNYINPNNKPNHQQNDNINNLLSNNQSVEEFFKREENWMSLSNHYHYYSISSNIKIHTDIYKDFDIQVNGILKKPELHTSDCLLEHDSIIEGPQPQTPSTTDNKDFIISEENIEITNYDGGFGETIISSTKLPLIRSEFDDYFINSNVDFGLVRIGEQSSKYLYIHNPLDVELVAQLLPFNTQFEISSLLLKGETKLPSTLETIFNLSNDTSIGNSFNINSQQHNGSSKNHQHLNSLHFEYFNDEVFNEFIKIPPLETFKLGPIVFSPKNLYSYSWIIYLKNNYTLLSPIKLTGRGGGGKLAMVSSDQISNVSSQQQGDSAFNSNNGNEIHTLLFELNKTHLSPCIFKKKDEVDINSEILFDKNQKTIPKSQKDTKIELNKTISIVNRGNLPIEIHDFFINDVKCSGYGFKIQFCNEIRSQGIKLLNPGESFKLTLTFEPDFTTSMLKRELIIKTNQKQFLFQLVGSIPHDYLPLCTHLHPTNFYEYHAKIVFIICMLILFIVLVFITFREFSKQQQLQQSHHHSLQPNRNSNGSGNSSNVSKTSKNVYKFSNHENPSSYRELILDDHHHNISHNNNNNNPQPNQQEIALPKSPDKSSSTTIVNGVTSNTTNQISNTLEQSIKNPNSSQKKKKSLTTISPILPRAINSSSDYEDNGLFEFNTSSSINNYNNNNSVGKVKDYSSTITPKKMEAGPSILKKKTNDDGSSSPSIIKSVVFADKPIIVPPSNKKVTINNDKKPVISPNSSNESLPTNINTNQPPTINNVDISSNGVEVSNTPSSIPQTNGTPSLGSSIPLPTQNDIILPNNINNTSITTTSTTSALKKYPKFEGKKKYEPKQEVISTTATPSLLPTPIQPTTSNYKRPHDQQTSTQPQQYKPTREPKEYKSKKFEKPKKVYIPKVKDPNSTSPTNTTTTTTTSTNNSSISTPSINHPTTNTNTSNNIASTPSFGSILGNNNNINQISDDLFNSNFFPFFSSPNNSNGYSSFMDLNSTPNSIDTNPFNWKPTSNPININSNSNNSASLSSTDSFKIQQPSIGVIGSGKSINHHMSSTSPLRDTSGSSPNKPSPLFDFGKEVVTPVNHHNQFPFNISNLYGHSIDGNSNNSSTNSTNTNTPNNYFGTLSFSSTPTYDLFSNNHSLFTNPSSSNSNPPSSSSPSNTSSNPSINNIKSNHSPISRSNPPSPTSHLFSSN